MVKMQADATMDNPQPSPPHTRDAVQRLNVDGKKPLPLIYTNKERSKHLFKLLASLDEALGATRE